MKKLLSFIPLDTLLTYAFLFLMQGIENSNPKAFRFLQKNGAIIDRFFEFYTKYKAIRNRSN